MRTFWAALLIGAGTFGTVLAAEPEGLEAKFHELETDKAAFRKICDDFVRDLERVSKCEPPACALPKGKAALLRIFRELEKVPDTSSGVRETHELVVSEKETLIKAAWFSKYNPRENELCALSRLSGTVPDIIRASKVVGLTTSERKDIKAFVVRLVKAETSYPTGILTQQVAVKMMKELADTKIYGISDSVAAEIGKLESDTVKLLQELAVEETAFIKTDAAAVLLVHNLERVAPLRARIADLANRL